MFKHKAIIAKNAFKYGHFKSCASSLSKRNGAHFELTDINWTTFFFLRNVDFGGFFNQCSKVKMIINKVENSLLDK